MISAGLLIDSRTQRIYSYCMKESVRILLKSRGAATGSPNQRSGAETTEYGIFRDG